MKKQTRNLIFSMIGLCLFLTAACGSEPGSSTTSNNPTPRVETPSDKGDRVVTGGDLQFMQEAAMGGMLEVELGRMAVEKAASPEVKKFGQRMVDDHSKAGQELTQLAAQKKVMLPQEKSPAHKETMEKLSKLNGAGFDRAYVANMVEDHEKDVTAFEAVAKTATDKDVKDFAAKTLPTLKEHLQMIREIAGKMNIKPKS